MKKSLALLMALATAATTAAWAHEHEGDKHDEKAEVGEVTVKGEVLDMACYLDHGASGAKHADCAKTCIESGLPVGIKTEDGKTYLVIGQHEPINKTLAPYAAKTITIKGKLVERDGIRMIANAEIEK